MSALASDRELVYDPLPTTVAEDPYPLYKRLREEAPLYHGVGFGAARRELWAVSRYDDVTAVLDDRERFVISMTPDVGGIFLQTEPPRYAMLRRIVRDRFTPKAVAALEQRVAERARAAIAAAELTGELDVQERFTWGFCASVGAMVVGAADEDVEQLMAWQTAASFGETDDAPEVVEGVAGLNGYWRALAEERTARPRDDLMSTAMAAVADGTAVLEDALDFCRNTFDASTIPLGHAIGNGLNVLGHHPDQRALLRRMGGDAQATRYAVDELIRFDSQAQSGQRHAREDTELMGQPIPKGALIVLVFGSTNRDERHFKDPDRLDLTRPPGRTLSFGHGIHFCLGAVLSRVVLRVALPLLLDAMPDYEVVGAPERGPVNAFTRAVISLPIAA